MMSETIQNSLDIDVGNAYHRTFLYGYVARDRPSLEMGGGAMYQCEIVHKVVLVLLFFANVHFHPALAQHITNECACLLVFSDGYIYSSNLSGYYQRQ